MKVKVNRDACIGCGACEAIANNVFELDDEGISTIKEELLEDDKEVGSVNEEDKDDTKEAIESCPTDAIIEV